jgi:hypothetical protein
LFDFVIEYANALPMFEAMTRLDNTSPSSKDTELTGESILVAGAPVPYSLIIIPPDPVNKRGFTEPDIAGG